MEGENPSIGTTPTGGESASAPSIQRSPNVEAENEVISNSNRTSVEENSEITSGKNRKRKSPAWNHFEEKYIGGKRKAICPDCKKVLGGESKNGTKHLLEHMKSCLYKKQNTINQSLLNHTKSNDGSMKLGTYTFDQDQAREELANMIVLHEYPLNMVEHVGFRRYSHALQPLFRPVSRNTIKRDIIRIFEYQKDKTMKLLESNGSRIALTTDMWTSNNQRRGFMAITSHFIDASWKLQSRLIRFIYVPCPHTAEVLANAFVDCLLDWNLDCKLSTLTVDNCTTNDAMIEVILDKIPPSSLILEGKLFHMRCCAHILNLVVRDGLDLINDSIEKIRYSVSFWTATPKRDEKFVETARQLKVPSTKKLELDCKTRWNSTYLMLNTALIYKDVFPRLKQRETLYKRIPTEEEWSKVMDICSKLEMFFDATELFSGTLYPTINIFFSHICQIKLAIDEWIGVDDIDVKIMASKMKVKFDKYWDIMNYLLTVGSILDPRYKMKMIEFYYPLVYGDTSSLEIEKIRQILYDLVKEYKKREKSSKEVNQGQELHTSSASSRPPLPKRGAYATKFEMFMDSTPVIEHVKSELDHYLEESLLPRNTHNFDILCWWKTNGIKYPTLHDIAKDVLSIPMTTVASESTFSASGRVLSPHRNRLHPKTVEALMCARDWLWSQIEESTTSNLQNFDDDSDTEEARVEVL